MTKHAHTQKSGVSEASGEALACITYKIIYGKPTRVLSDPITMDRHEAPVVTGKSREETGYEYSFYEFKLQDIGDAMMTGDKAYRCFYQYEARRLRADTLSNSSYMAQLQSGQNFLCK